MFSSIAATDRWAVFEVKADGTGLKQLTPNPWVQVPTKYPIMSKHPGEVVNIMPYGAFVKLEPGIEGLVHISEFAGEEDLRSKLELGKVYPFTITFFEPKDRRMTLKPAA